MYIDLDKIKRDFISDTKYKKFPMEEIYELKKQGTNVRRNSRRI